MAAEGGQVTEAQATELLARVGDLVQAVRIGVGVGLLLLGAVIYRLFRCGVTGN